MTTDANLLNSTLMTMQKRLGNQYEVHGLLMSFTLAEPVTRHVTGFATRGETHTFGFEVAGEGPVSDAMLEKTVDKCASQIEALYEKVNP